MPVEALLRRSGSERNSAFSQWGVFQGCGDEDPSLDLCNKAASRN